MAKSRMVDTRFWDDNYTSNLDPIEKLLFLYCLTNTHTNICWVYEIPLKSIASDTWIDKDMVLKIMTRFEKEWKIIYKDWWVAIRNFIKYQNQWSPKVKAWIDKELEKVPEWLNSLLQIPYTYPMDTLSHSNTNTNSNSNTNLNTNSNLTISSKEDTEKSVVIKKEYWDPIINLIIDTIKKYNNWIIDGTIASNRKYWKMLRDKMDKIKWFDWDYCYFLTRLITQTDQYNIWKTTSCESIYYNLASLVAKIKTNNIETRVKEEELKPKTWRLQPTTSLTTT